MNYLSLHDYDKAIQLAIATEQPGRLLSLFKDIRSSPITVIKTESQHSFWTRKRHSCQCMSSSSYTSTVITHTSLRA